MVHAMSRVFLATIGIESGREGQQRQKLEFVSNWRSRLQQVKRIRSWLEADGIGAPDDNDGNPLSGMDRDVSMWTL